MITDTYIPCKFYKDNLSTKRLETNITTFKKDNEGKHDIFQTILVWLNVSKFTIILCNANRAKNKNYVIMSIAEGILNEIEHI